MNREYDTETTARIHELARARALQLRREAIDAFFAQCAAAVRRALARPHPRPGYRTQVEA
jgi:hypothetical protein